MIPAAKPSASNAMHNSAHQLKSCGMAFLQITKPMAKASSTTFLANVAQLEITSASPKHPQSETGFEIAMYSVTGVISR